MQAFSVSRWVRKIGQCWPGLGPHRGSCAVQVGANESGGAEGGSKCTPNWNHVMRMKVQVTSQVPQLGTFGDTFTPSWAHRRHNTGNVAQHDEASSMPTKRGKCQWKGAFWPFRLVSVILKPCQPQLGTKLLPSGSNFSQTATCWSQVGPKYRCSQVGPSWAEVGALLAEVDPKEPMWRPGRIETVHLAECWADLQNAQIPQRGTDFWRTRAPPQLKLYQSDRSVRSHPLLNYHASALSVRADLYLHAITINYITQNKSALCTCIAWHCIGLHSSQLHYIMYIADVYHCRSYDMDIHHIRSEKPELLASNQGTLQLHQLLHPFPQFLQFRQGPAALRRNPGQPPSGAWKYLKMGYIPQLFIRKMIIHHWNGVIVWVITSDYHEFSYVSVKYPNFIKFPWPCPRFHGSLAPFPRSPTCPAPWSATWHLPLQRLRPKASGPTGNPKRSGTPAEVQWNPDVKWCTN